MTYDNAWTLQQFKANGPLSYIFFWGHRQNKDRSIGKTCFSQWFAAGFTNKGIHYPTAEHWMMAEKARLFEDEVALAKIIQDPSPKAVKAYGIYAK